jgi:hypothetical protein
MSYRMRTLVFASFALALLPHEISAAGLPPWRFGMSKSEVSGFKQFGPYREFSNGDVETFNGTFEGRKENIQFFFKNDRLVRIGVYLWEGKDARKGLSVFERAYDLLRRKYGKMALLEMTGPPGQRATGSTVTIPVGGKVDLAGKTQMFPLKQPGDVRVSAKFMSYYASGAQWHAVAIFLDPPT